MKKTEKGLAEKVMFTIHIDSHYEVEQSFREYFEFFEKLDRHKRDDILYSRTCESYVDYEVKKMNEEYKRSKEK